MQFDAAKGRLLSALQQEVTDRRVLEAMAGVPREVFVSPEQAALAYENIPLPIGEGQTISQPLIVAIMLQALALEPRDKVLELGTGSGYQAALLSRLAAQVVTVERLVILMERARATLRRLHYDNVTVLPASPVLGCPQRAPFDAIIVAAGAPAATMDLTDQLAVGGRLVIPVGDRLEQTVERVVRLPEGLRTTYHGPCRFVPLIGSGAWPDGTDHHGLTPP